MNIGVIRESETFDRRVALTPPVVRHLVEAGNLVWIERGAGEGAMFQDDEYIRAGAQIIYSPADVVQRSEVVVKISVPILQELDFCPKGVMLMAFYHMAVADRGVFQRMIERNITAVGCEIIQMDDGRLPVLAAISEIAGQMTIPVAAHLLRSSSGGRGILLGGSPGVPPAHVVILGAGTVGGWAARTAVATGARVTVLDSHAEKLRRLLERLPNVATCLAEPDAIAEAVTGADVVIGAVLVAGRLTPHVVTKQMVEGMKRGAAIIDVAIDQGGCVETSRPTTIADPTFAYHGVTHYCVPNLTADMGRCTSIAVAQAMLPYLLWIGKNGIQAGLASCRDLVRGTYVHGGSCVNAQLAETWKVPYRPLTDLLSREAGVA
jgi:alanine dehydrogenase